MSFMAFSIMLVYVYVGHNVLFKIQLYLYHLSDFEKFFSIRLLSRTKSSHFGYSISGEFLTIGDSSANALSDEETILDGLALS